MLAEARARKNFTIPEVAQQLKLSVSQIEALEADAYARLPGAVFVRGFVRNYARLLELDSELLIAALDFPQQHVTLGAALPHSSSSPFAEHYLSRRSRYTAVLLLLVGALALYVFLAAEPKVVVTVQPPLASAPAITPASTLTPAAALPVMTPVTVSAATPASSPVPANSPAPTAGGERSAAVVTVRPSPGMTEVRFTFTADSWIEVRDRSNRILLSQRNRAGTEQQLQGQPPLSLVVGNAHGVRLTYQGAPVDLAPHIRAEVARFTLE